MLVLKVNTKLVPFITKTILKTPRTVIHLSAAQFIYHQVQYRLNRSAHRLRCLLSWGIPRRTAIFTRLEQILRHALPMLEKIFLWYHISMLLAIVRFSKKLLSIGSQLANVAMYEADCESRTTVYLLYLCTTHSTCAYLFVALPRDWAAVRSAKHGQACRRSLATRCVLCQRWAEGCWKRCG